MTTISLVVPAYNEERNIPAFLAAVTPVLEAIGEPFEIIFIDDGSKDGTFGMLAAAASQDPRIKVVGLARNFGKDIALSAGLAHASGKAAIPIDCDLQHPVDLIPEFVAKWREGFDDIHGTRLEREGESWLKTATAHAFYRVIGHLSRTPIPRDTGDFRLLSPRALAALKQLRERNRFMKGLFGWVGYNQTAIGYHRDPRAAGASKFNFWRLWNFALEGITSFSTAPLRVATYLGVATALLAFAYGVWIVVKALLWSDPVAGWPTMMVVILFLGGVQLMALGLIGEYLGRMYDEAKQRPLYLVDAWRPATGVSSAQSDSTEGVGHAHGPSPARIESA